MVSYDWTPKVQDEDFTVTLFMKLPEGKKALRKGMLRYGLYAVICCFLIAWDHFLCFPMTGADFFLGFWGVYYLFQCVVLPVKTKRAMRQSFLKRDPRLVSGTWHLEFREDGLAVSGPFENSLTFWSGFRYWGTGENYLFLSDISGACILIDRSSIPESDLQEIENLLRSKQVPYLDLF